MADILAVLEKFRKINASFPFTDPIKRWKEQGRQVIGWSCCGNYIPEEIIHAAGMLPVRVTGDQEQISLDEADSYLQIYSCSFSRSCFELVLKNQFDFLDGMVMASNCDDIRRLADNWNQYLSIPLVYFLDIPRKYNERACRLYERGLLELKQRLEQQFNVRISNDGLRESIAVYNRSRKLFKMLYDLRKKDNPPLSGAEALEVLNASTRMPREDFNNLLEKLYQEASQMDGRLPGKVRLMLCGCILNNPDFIKGIEDLGGLIVADGLCTGIGYWTDLVDNGPDITPLEALSRRYLGKFPTVRMDHTEERYNQILKLIKEFKVDGVIMETIRFCSPTIWDWPRLRDRLMKQGIPFLELEVEYGIWVTGQIKTRVEAFLEMITGRGR